MKKRIINYRLKIDNLLDNPDKISKEEWKRILQEHLTQIAFFQHERLVHLIVTVTFAILTMMSIIASIMISNLVLLVLTLLFLVLLVPYIMHYYTLENEVQKMYTQYDEILKHLSQLAYKRVQRATYAHIKVESYQRQNPAQPGLLPLTAYTKLLRVCRIAYENQQRPCMDAWARCYAPWTAHKSRLCQKATTGICNSYRHLAAQFMRERAESPGCAGFVPLATTVQFSYFLSFFCAVESISLIRFSWFTSEAPGS